MTTAPDRSHSLNVRGLRIHVDEWVAPGRESVAAGESVVAGESGTAGATLVFAHPTGFLGAIWRPIIARLRSRGVGCRILTVDQRGHGLSSKPDTGYEWIEYSQDLLGTLEQLGVTGAIGVGHSAGATTIAMAAAADAALFSRIVLLDPILFDEEVAARFRELGDNPMSLRTRTRRMVWSSREELRQSFSAREPYSQWTDEALRNYLEHGVFDRPDGEVELLCPGRIEAQVYANSTGSNGMNSLKRVACPALVVRGAESPTFPEERALQVAELLPQGRLESMPDTGHFLPMQRPDETCSIIIAELNANGYTGKDAERG